MVEGTEPPRLLLNMALGAIVQLNDVSAQEREQRELYALAVQVLKVDE